MSDWLTPAEAALVYVENGWQIVAQDANKVPLWIPGIQEHGKNSPATDEDEVERLIKAAGERFLGVGVVTGGDQPLCIDMDGPCAIEAMQRLLGERWNFTPREKTRHGMHLFFAPAPEITRTIRALPDLTASCPHEQACGIDVLGTAQSGQPGQLVAVSPSPGREWIGPGTSLSPVEDLPPLPIDIAERLPKLHTQPLLDNDAEDLDLSSLSSDIPWPLALAIEDACSQIKDMKKGERHNKMLRLLNKIGRKAAWYGCGAVDEIATRLVQAALRAGFPAQRVETRIRDGIIYGLKHGKRRDNTVDAERDLIEAPLVEQLTVEKAREVLRSAVTYDRAVVRAGTGTGKTSELIPLLAKKGEPLVIVTQTLELCQQIADILEGHNIDVAVHYGRQMPIDEKPGPYTCVHLETIGRPLGEKRHAIAPNACAVCCEGHLAMMEWHMSHGALDKAAATDARMRELAEKQGRNLDAVRPCGWIEQVLKEPETDCIVTTAQAFTPTMLDYRSHKGSRKRKLIIDENVALMDSVLVDGNTIADWLAQLDQGIDKAREFGDEDHAGKLLDIKQLYSNINLLLAKSASAEGQESQRIRDEIAELLLGAKSTIEQTVRKRGLATAEWERPLVEWSGQPEEYPLRACVDLMSSAEAGALWVTRGALHASAPTSVYTSLLRGDSNGWIILDATPDPIVLDFAEHTGAMVIDAIPSQPVKVDYYVARTHGRGALIRHGNGVEVNPLAAYLTAHPNSACITHKPVANLLKKFDHIEEKRITHWGRHRGVNSFDGMDLIIDGLPVPSPLDLTLAWKRYVHALWLMGAEDVVALREMAETDWIDERTWANVCITPEAIAPSPMMWPAGENQRNWFSLLLGNELVQAIGRTRAINHPEKTTHVTILGPPVPLTLAGISNVTVHTEDPDEWTATRETKCLAHGIEGEIKMAGTLLDMRRDGIKPTRRALEAALRAKGAGWGLRSEVVNDFLRIYGGMSDTDLVDLIEYLEQRAEEIIRHGPTKVGIKILVKHMRKHGADCHCVEGLAGRFLAPGVTPVIFLRRKIPLRI